MEHSCHGASDGEADHRDSGGFFLLRLFLKKFALSKNACMGSCCGNSRIVFRFIYVSVDQYPAVPEPADYNPRRPVNIS